MSRAGISFSQAFNKSTTDTRLVLRMATAAVVLDTKNLVLDLKIEILAISNPNLTFSTYPLEESTVVPRYYLQKFQTVVKILC